ncbi:MAG: hypothetical protein R2771_11770 [Saprospiraceae bacterium]
MDGASRYPDANWQSMGIYVTDQHRFNRKFVFQLGARYNSYSIDAQFDNTFYPFPFTEADIKNGAVTGSSGVCVQT